MIGISELYRYPTDQKVLLMNPPSQILHVSNITKEFCRREEFIQNVFGVYGIIETIKYIILFI